MALSVFSFFLSLLKQSKYTDRIYLLKKAIKDKEWRCEEEEEKKKMKYERK